MFKYYVCPVIRKNAGGPLFNVFRLNTDTDELEETEMTPTHTRAVAEARAEQLNRRFTERVEE